MTVVFEIVSSLFSLFCFLSFCAENPSQKNGACHHSKDAKGISNIKDDENLAPMNTMYVCMYFIYTTYFITLFTSVKRMLDFVFLDIKITDFVVFNIR